MNSCGQCPHVGTARGKQHAVTNDAGATLDSSAVSRASSSACALPQAMAMETSTRSWYPLAGQHLNFAVEMTEVRAARAKELAHGHVHGAGGHHHQACADLPTSRRTVRSAGSCGKLGRTAKSGVVECVQAPFRRVCSSPLACRTHSRFINGRLPMRRHSKPRARASR